MVAQHTYREGNQWGMTVPELLEDVVTQGRPLHLEWTAGAWLVGARPPECGARLFPMPLVWVTGKFGKVTE